MAQMVSKFLVAVALLSGSALAQSAKYSIQMSGLAQVSSRLAATADGYTPILRGAIHTSQQKELVMGVSLESGLYTDTTVVSKNLQADKSVAMARILVRVMVDGVEAYPGSVTFAEREQGLVAKFAGYFECTDLNNDGIMNFGECDYTKPEELQLWLKTLNANAFFFALPDLQQGEHIVEVQAKVETSTSFQLGAAAASAWIGKGTVSIEEARLIKGSTLDANSFDFSL
jgi:hypothetical protein